jgi:hypothetical protein
MFLEEKCAFRAGIPEGIWPISTEKTLLLSLVIFLFEKKNIVFVERILNNVENISRSFFFVRAWRGRRPDPD